MVQIWIRVRVRDTIEVRVRVGRVRVRGSKINLIEQSCGVYYDKVENIKSKFKKSHSKSRR